MLNSRCYSRKVLIMLDKRSCLLVAAIFLLLASTVFAEDPGDTDPWQPILFLKGEWVGAGVGMGGDSKVSHIYKYVIKEKFLHLNTQSIFRSQEEDKPDDIHEDWGFFSYDSDRGVLVLRQFLSEGYVNTYVLATVEPNSNTLVFISELTESAGGMRARITYKVHNQDEYELLLDLAPPGKEFFNCRHLEMKRVNGISSEQ